MYINKFQQGGQAGDGQAFIQWLAQVFGVQDESQLQQLALQLGEEGLAQMQLIFLQYPDPELAKPVILQMMSQAQSARRGAVLNYYKKIMNICGPNETAVFYQKGGKVCKTCQAKQKGGQLEDADDEEGNINNPKAFSNGSHKPSVTRSFNSFLQKGLLNIPYNQGLQMQMPPSLRYISPYNYDPMQQMPYNNGPMQQMPYNNYNFIPNGNNYNPYSSMDPGFLQIYTVNPYLNTQTPSAVLAQQPITVRPDYYLPLSVPYPY